jgi:hypothetical protein
MPSRSVFARLLLLALVLAGAAPAAAQVSRFRYRPEIAASGVMYRYLKTRLDGGHAGEIALFVAAPDSLESFKYSPNGGGTEFSLVKATMDWRIFSPAGFESWRARAGGQRTLAATLEFDPTARVLRVAMGDLRQTAAVGFLPWHSYDFDFASLNVTLRHLEDPKKPFTIGLADPTYREGAPAFAFKDTVWVRYAGKETRNGVATRKYRVDGPGLENRGGFMWVDVKGGHLVEFEMHIGDEPGFDDARMRLLDIRPMNRVEWDAFIESKFVPRKAP